MSDFRLTRGDTTTFDVAVVKWNASTQVFDPVPLSGVKAWFTVKATTRDLDDAALLTYNTTDDPAKIIPVGNPDDGILRVSIPPDDSEDLPVTYLPYDVQVLEPTGEVTTVLAGFIEVSRDSTISRV